MDNSDKSQVIEIKPAVIKISPFGFHLYAKQFHDVGEWAKHTDTFSPVPYYIYCRSIELSLKAFLLLKDVEKPELKSRKLGHNLIKVVSKAQELGLNSLVTVSDIELQNLELANDYYVNKGFEYFNVTKAVTGYSNLPDLCKITP